MFETKDEADPTADPTADPAAEIALSRGTRGKSPCLAQRRWGK